MGEDLIQSCYPIFNAKKIIYINKYLYYYRQSHTGMTKQFSESNIDGEFTKFNIHLYEQRMRYSELCDQKEEIQQEIERITLGYFVSFYRRGLALCSSKELRKRWMDKNWTGVLPEKIKIDYSSGIIKTKVTDSIYISAVINNHESVIIFLESIRKIIHWLKNKLR